MDTNEFLSKTCKIVAPDEAKEIIGKSLEFSYLISQGDFSVLDNYTKKGVSEDEWKSIKADILTWCDLASKYKPDFQKPLHSLINGDLSLTYNDLYSISNALEAYSRVTRMGQIDICLEVIGILNYRPNIIHRVVDRFAQMIDRNPTHEDSAFEMHREIRQHLGVARAIADDDKDDIWLGGVTFDGPVSRLNLLGFEIVDSNLSNEDKAEFLSNRFRRSSNSSTIQF